MIATRIEVTMDTTIKVTRIEVTMRTTMMVTIIEDIKVVTHPMIDTTGSLKVTNQRMITRVATNLVAFNETATEIMSINL